MNAVTYLLVFASSSTEYFSITAPGLVNVLSEMKAPLTFISYSITVLAQMGSTVLIAYKTWYVAWFLRILNS